MSEKADWRKQLIAELGSLLASYGFVFIAAGRAYHRNTSAGWESIHLAFIDHTVDFDIVVDAEIRFDEIQERINHGGDKRGRYATIGCEYGNLIGTGQHRWSISSADDVLPTAHGILKICRVTLFSFFQQYSDLATVYETLRNGGPVARLLMPLEDKRKDIIEAAASVLKMPE